MGERRKVLALFPLQSSCEPCHILTKRWALQLGDAARATEILTSSRRGETQRYLSDRSDPSLCQTPLQKPSGRTWEKEDLNYHKSSGAWLGTQPGFPQKNLCKFNDSNTARRNMLWDKHPWAVRSPPGEDLTLPKERDQPGLKLADPGGGCGHIHGLLPTTKHNLQRREATTLRSARRGGRRALGKPPANPADPTNS